MEIEIKAKCFESAFSNIRSKLLDLGAEKKREKRQIDQYYNLPHMDIRGSKKYIRLRQEGKRAIFAYHENLESGLTKEFEVKINDKNVFEQILEKFGFRKLGIIDKKRETFQLEEFFICLDMVKGVGTFIEIETYGDESNWKQKKDECISLLKKLGLDEKSITNEYLCDIATR